MILDRRFSLLRHIILRHIPAAAAGPVAALLAVAAMYSAAAEGPRTLPHERASTWRTRVVPATAAVGPHHGARSAPAASLTTGSLPPAIPLIGHREGLASFYWQAQRTASGETFDKGALTAAHKTLPFNTRVRVTHLSNGRSVVVRINDRGPFTPGRIIDLSDAAADVIGMRSNGLARVRLEVVP